jgi:O-succinylbenzoic acid--CoA ligase
MIAHPLREAAENRHDSPAIIAPGQSLTYGPYDEQVRAMAHALRQMPLTKGAVLALAMAPSHPLAVAIMASIDADIIACPLNIRWPAKAMANALETIGCTHALIDDSAKALFDDDALSFLSTIHVDDLAKDEAAPPGRDTLEEDQPAIIVFTSGSTGTPKGALLSYGNLYHNALTSNQVIHMNYDDRWLLSLPLHHVAGLGVLFRSLMAKAAVVVPDAGDTLAQAIRRHAITHTSLVATQMQRLLRDEDRAEALGTLKAILIGGSTIPSTLIRECIGLGLPIHTTYGLTEMASQVTVTPAGSSVHALFTAGRPHNPHDIALSNDGEVLVRGETLFQGYYSHGGLDHPLNEDGWFATGDVGRFDDEGYLSITGRQDTMFISGGENVHPESIERELLRIVGIAQVVVAPVEDAEYGQRPVAFIRTEDGSAPDSDTLAEALAEQLPSYALPVAYHPWPSITEEGMKIDRAEFARLAKEAI